MERKAGNRMETRQNGIALLGVFDCWCLMMFGVRDGNKIEVALVRCAWACLCACVCACVRRMHA